MSVYIPEKLRSFVINRAHHCCEYCLMHDVHLVFGGHIDHIISIKHDGKTVEANLAYACLVCNVNKGSDIASFNHDKEEYIPLFHPRKQVWKEHFSYDEGKINPLTEIGNATIRTLQINRFDRISRRLALSSISAYPGPLFNFF